jgi:hypothetical protein
MTTNDVDVDGVDDVDFVVEVASEDDRKKKSCCH